MTRNQIFSNYLLYISSTYTDATYIFYESHLRCFYNYFKEDEITTENLLKYITYSRKNNISNATINKRILAVKRAYKYNNLSHLVLENYKKLKETNKRFDVLTDDECEMLLQYVDDAPLSLQNKVIIHLLYDTGMRLNELLHIRITNINFDKKTIFLEYTKTSSERIVFFRKKTEKLLSKFVTKRIKQNGGSLDDETLLITYTKSGIESLFYRLRKELNFKKLHPHMLRHTFATYLIRKNASMDLIKNILGHSNYDMTLRYLHQNTTDLQKQLQLVDNAF